MGKVLEFKKAISQEREERLIRTHVYLNRYNNLIEQLRLLAQETKIREESAVKTTL